MSPETGGPGQQRPGGERPEEEQPGPPGSAPPPPPPQHGRPAPPTYPPGYGQPPYGSPYPPPYPPGQPAWPPYPAPQPYPYPTPQQPLQQWARQTAPRHLQPLPAFPHPEPRRYEQMLRTWNYAWWKPLVGMLLLAVGMLVVAPVVLLPVLVLGVSLEGGPFWERFEQAVTLQAIGPSALLYLNLTLGASILVCWLVMRYIHRMRPRWLTSVVPKMRWRFFWICVGISVVALIAQVLVSQVLPGSQETELTGKLNDFTATTLAIALVVVLTTPLQAAGEEYVFRGYLMQAIGSLFAVSSDRAAQVMSRWTALLTTSLLFALAHGAQNFPLFFDRLMFGLIAGWLVLRTGGLEAGIAMHILNNFLAFGFAVSFGDLNESLNVSEVSWWNIPLTLTQAGTYAVLVLLVARRMRLQNRTRPPATPRHDERGPGADPVAVGG